MVDELKPNRFYCPHCGTENPPFVFLQNEKQSAIGTLAYFVISCGGVITPEPCKVCDGSGTVQLYGPNSVKRACKACGGLKQSPYECRRILGISLVAYNPIPVLGVSL